METHLNENLAKFIEILSEIPPTTWDTIVCQEPEWTNMYPFQAPYGFGPFSVLMVACGLNDYQLKRKSEIGYWPIIKTHLSLEIPPKNPQDLAKMLDPFFQQERLSEQKLRRMDQFLSSPLALWLWKSRPEEVILKFEDCWISLGQVMNQGIEKKTIVFAMKCLGLSLLMAGETRIPFDNIPIPVDFRIIGVTEKMNSGCNSDESIRRIWNHILIGIRKGNPNVTMIHLDSLAWQIGRLNKIQIEEYFRSLGIPKTGASLSKLLCIAV